jgi:hypothetical protein
LTHTGAQAADPDFLGDPRMTKEKDDLFFGSGLRFFRLRGKLDIKRAAEREA